MTMLKEKPPNILYATKLFLRNEIKTFPHKSKMNLSLADQHPLQEILKGSPLGRSERTLDSSVKPHKALVKLTT